ncbi:SPOSA6832_04675, partial [Sporobolomyces salmonicolor]
MASELPSTLASHLPPSALSSPAPPLPVPTFQDLTDSEGSSPDEQDWEAIIAAAEAAFSEEQIADMTTFLKERGLFAFVKEYVETRGLSVRTLLLAFGIMIRPDTPLNDQLRMLKIACSRVYVPAFSSPSLPLPSTHGLVLNRLRNRDRLEQYQTVDDVVNLIRKSKRILVLTGAGVSTSCGIPDFRSPTGLYARLKAEGNWDLDDPQDMFDLSYFRERPDVFYGFAKEIYPSNFVPSPCHRFVRLLELNDKLLRNYTQNIDGLFEQVGVERMLNCHGSFASASCLLCHRRFPGSHIESDVFAQRVPLCPFCVAAAEEREREREREREQERPKKKRKGNEWEDDDDGTEDEGFGFGFGAGNGGKGPGAGKWGYGTEWAGKPLIKPDIVFFGRTDELSWVYVVGVSPVAQLPSHLPHSIPQILINRDPVGHHNFDICLLGDGDTIVRFLCRKLAEAEANDQAQRRAEGTECTTPREEGENGSEWDLEKQVPVQRKTLHPARAPDASHAPPVAPALAASASGLPSSSASALPVSSNDLDPAPDAPHPDPATIEPDRVSTSHVWLFPGANREARWISAVREAFDAPSPSGDDEGDEEGVKDEEEKGTVEGTVEIPASLAPGVREGEGSDGQDEDEDEDEDDREEKEGA